MSYEALFKPIKIGNKEVKNRIFMPPISTNLANKGYVSDELIKHYADRAKGGVGLIVTEVVTVEPTYIYLPGDMSIHDDSFIEGWKKLYDAVHQYDTVLLPQLFHPAFMAFPMKDTPQLVAPSNVGPHYAKSAPRPLEIDEIKVIIEQFADAAYRVLLAGGDGVEIHAAHAHGLLGGFLSPLYNKRFDEYGGDLNGRLKLTLDVIKAVRKRCGEDFIIDVRISGDEYSDGGLNLNDMIYVSKQLEKVGANMLHVSGGITIKRGSAIPAGGSQGAHAYVASEIKKYVNIPVASVGRILDPWFANELIENNICDAVMMGRANLCEPNLANKIKEDKIDDIKPCIGCLKCLNGIMFGKRIACSVNPSFELENEENLPLATTKKKVLVIGGGPSGMEAAYVCAKKGHEVILCDKNKQLGGQMLLAATPIGKQDLTKLVKYLVHRLKKMNVEIRLNTNVDQTMFENEFKDYEVICAHGAKPITLPLFNNFKHVITADDLLSGKAFANQKVLVVGGGSVGCEVADYLAPLVNDRYIRNREITLMEMQSEIMMKEVGAVRSALVLRMINKGIRIECNAKVLEATNDTITYEQNGVIKQLEGIDTIVLALGYKVDHSMEELLKQLNKTYYMIGDSKQVGSIKEAINDAYQVAKNI